MGHFKAALAGLALSLSLSACATSSHQIAPTNPAVELAQLMLGEFETAPDGTENGFVDRRMSLPAFGEGQWIYYQLNKGTEHALYRQRVIQLLPKENGTVQQITYRLKDETSFTDLWDTQKPITQDDLVLAFASGCDQIWEKEDTLWVSEIEAQTCVIDSKRRGKQIGVGSRARLGADSLQQGEAGYELDGTFLWGTPEGEWITLNRQ